MPQRPDSTTSKPPLHQIIIDQNPAFRPLLTRTRSCPGRLGYTDSSEPAGSTGIGCGPTTNPNPNLVLHSLRDYYRYRIHGDSDHTFTGRRQLILSDQDHVTGASDLAITTKGPMAAATEESARKKALIKDILTWGVWGFIELTHKELAKVQTLELSAPIASEALANTTIALQLQLQVTVCDAGIPKELSELTRERCQALLADHKTPVVLRTKGVIEFRAKKGVDAVLPLGLFHAGAGVRPEVGVYYELQSIQPKGKDAKDLAKAHFRAPPINAKLAKKWQEGSSALFAANIGITTLVTAGIGPEAGAQGIRLGAGAGVETKLSAEKVWEIGVIRLAGDKVRVIIRESKDFKKDLAAILRAGLSRGEQLDSQITWGKGVLLAAAKHEGEKSVAAWYNELLSVSAKAGVSHGNLSKAIGAWTCDLSQPAARAAYNELMNFSTVKAQALAMVPGSGVTEAKHTETQEALRLEQYVKVFGQKIAVKEYLSQCRFGSMSDQSSHRYRFARQETSFESGNFLIGHSSIKWVTIREESNVNGNQTFFNLCYVRKNLATKVSDLRVFVNFARLLGLEDAADFHPDLLELGMVQAAFSEEDDSTEAVDLYFTEAGLTTIGYQESACAKSVFLACARQLDPQLAAFAALSANQWQDLTQLCGYYLDKDFWLGRISDSFGLTSGSIHQIMREFEARFPERIIKADAEALKDILMAANYFGRMVAEYRGPQPSGSVKSSRSQLDIFFGGIAEANALNFRPAIAALAIMAGPECVLIHKLSLTTKAGSYVAQDEGALEFQAPLVLRKQLQT